MTPQEIRDYRENVVKLKVVYDTEGQSALGELLRFQTLAIYEVAAQLAELNDRVELWATVVSERMRR